MFFIGLLHMHNGRFSKTGLSLAFSGLCFGRFTLSENGPDLRLMTMRAKPVLGFAMQVLKRWTGSDHHPERRLDIGRRVLRPLPLCHQEFPEVTGVLLAQNGVELRPECCIV
jgi:hypothetical protein